MSINWSELNDTTQCDTEFLSEITTDLIFEAETLYADMKNGILNNDLKSIYAAAHKIKGTARYMYCDELSQVSERIQKSAKEYLTHETIDNLCVLLVEYNKVLTKLKSDVYNYFEHTIRK